MYNVISVYVTKKVNYFQDSVLDLNDLPTQSATLNNGPVSPFTLASGAIMSLIWCVPSLTATPATSGLKRFYLFKTKSQRRIRNKILFQRGANLSKQKKGRYQTPRNPLALYPTLLPDEFLGPLLSVKVPGAILPACKFKSPAHFEQPVASPLFKNW